MTRARRRAGAALAIAVGLAVGGCQRMSPDGVLDCPTPVTFVEQPARAGDATGRPESEAIDIALRRHPTQGSEEIVQIDDQTFSSVVDGSERLVISLERLENGNVFVSQIRGCG